MIALRKSVENLSFQVGGMNASIYDLKLANNEKSVIYTSTADRGSVVQAGLDKARKWIQGATKSNTVQSKILSDEELGIIKAMDNEKRLVAFITPKINSILSEIGSSLVLVNSEEYKWIKSTSGSSSNYAKPNLFS